jgi:chemotaxis protein MotB
MSVLHWLSGGLALAMLAATSGCALIPRAQLETLRTQNRVLTEQNRAQLVEIENLNIHARNTEDQLHRTEEELALLEDRVGMDHKQLADFQRERARLQGRFLGTVNGRSCMPPEVSGRLAEISQRYPALRFDSQTGIAKLDTDVLFDSGKEELKRGADKVLGELAKVLNTPEARDLKLLVVGHTDNRRIAKKPGRDKYPTNFHLSTARALAVAGQLRALGVERERMGVAGFGSHQPIAPNTTPRDRHKNRRVELFVMAPDVPVVGWTDSMPSVY